VNDCSGPRGKSEIVRVAKRTRSAPALRPRGREVLPRGRELGRRVILGTFSGAFLGLLEFAVLALRPGSSFGPDGPLVCAASIISLLSATLAASAVVLDRALEAAIPRRRSLWAGTALATTMVATSAANGFAYRNLFPVPHLLLSIASVLSTLALAILAFRRISSVTSGVLRRWSAVGSIALLLGGVITAMALHDRHSLRAMLIHEGSISAKVVVALSKLPISHDRRFLHATESQRAEAVGSSHPPEHGPRCRWPPPEAIESQGDLAGYDLLWITIDALRGDLGGPKMARTLPKTMARLPAAIIFDRAYAPAPRTTYSTYAMLSGQYPHHLGFVPATTTVDDEIIPLQDEHPIMLDPRKWKLLHRYPVGDRTPTLPSLLRRGDYTSVAVIPHVGLLPATGITREFDHVDLSPYLLNNRRDAAGITSRYSADATISALLRDDSQAPRFTWVHFLDPHHPYEASAPATHDSPAPIRYLSEIGRVDREIARVLDALDVRNPPRPTLVVVTGDHGEEFRDHGGLLHGTTLYEELLHVPLFFAVHDPGLGPQRPPKIVARIRTPVSLVDLTPTMIDLLGVFSDRAFDGRSLAGVLRGEPLAPRPLLLYNTTYTPGGDRRAAVVEGRWKLIVEEPERTAELYDLQVDPKETKNLIDRERQVASRLWCLLEQTGALGPLPSRPADEGHSDGRRQVDG